jgi:hypothetical protein
MNRICYKVFRECSHGKLELHGYCGLLPNLLIAERSKRWDAIAFLPARSPVS